MTETYHLIFCDPDNQVLIRLSFDYKRDQQFYILDEVGEIVYKVLETVGLLGKHPNHNASWTRDIFVHQLTYYKSDCESYDGEICTVCFFTEAYMSDWYFRKYYGYLL